MEIVHSVATAYSNPAHAAAREVSARTQAVLPVITAQSFRPRCGM